MILPGRISLVFLQEMLAALQAFAESSPQTNQTVLPTDQRRLLQDRDSREKRSSTPLRKPPIRSPQTQLEELVQQAKYDVLPRSEQRRREYERDVLNLLQSCPRIAEQGGVWSELLIWATMRGIVPVMKALFDLGIDVNVPYGSVLALNCIECRKQSLELLDLLISAGASVAAAGGWGRTALHKACLNARSQDRSTALKIIDRLIAAGASVNAWDNCRTTPLELLIRPESGDLSAVFDHLIDSGATIDACHFRGARAIWDAVQANQPKLVSRLLKLGAAVAFSPGEYPEATAIERIIIAANRHCPSSVRMLELADLSGVNRPFIVPRTRITKLVEPIQGIWYPDLPTPAKVREIRPPKFVNRWVDPEYSWNSTGSRYTPEIWTADVARFSSVRLEIRGQTLTYQYPLGNHVAWIRETKRTAFGVSFKLDTGRGLVPYDFSCKDDELRIYGTAPMTDERHLIWRRV